MNFENRHAYFHFSSGVRKSGRFALGDEAQKFLATFRGLARSRQNELKAGNYLYRAVRDFREIELPDGSPDICGASEDRLRPKAEFASDGRVNSRGIPCLYLASSIDTAISEVRPWIGERVSVATFHITSDLKLVNFSIFHGRLGILNLSFPQIFGEREISPQLADQCVWADIDNAFSTPVSRSDNHASYVPTQILAEALKEDGVDGLVYKSAFGGDNGYNVALFDVKAGDIVKCALHEIRAISVEHSECGNPWFKRASNSM